MQTLYFVLYLLALVAFVGATFTARLERLHARSSAALLPLGLALVTLVWMLQALNKV